MSLDNIQDNYFGCAETPVWIPDGFDVSRIPPCKSYALRLVSQIAGPGGVSPRADGLLIDENPTVTFSVNGIQHNLKEAILMFGGAHRLPGRSEPCKAELMIIFQHITDFDKQICLCLPVEIGTGRANKYFETLGRGVQKDRPTLGMIIDQNAGFMNFRGADIRGRTAKNPQDRAFCNPVKRVLTYYVCLKPVVITNSDYMRLLERAGPSRVGPAKPLTPLVNARITQLASVINGITIEYEPPEVAKPTYGVPTNAMKCYRLDENRDIKDGKVYVGGKGRTLQRELDAEEDDIEDMEASSIKPGDIQKWLGIIIGVTIGVIICAIIAVKVWGNTFSKYFEAQGLYNLPVSASAITSTLPKVEFPTICPSK